jgi:hypothetical protein
MELVMEQRHAELKNRWISCGSPCPPTFDDAPKTLAERVAQYDTEKRLIRDRDRTLDTALPGPSQAVPTPLQRATALMNQTAARRELPGYGPRQRTAPVTFPLSDLAESDGEIVYLIQIPSARVIRTTFGDYRSRQAEFPFGYLHVPSLSSVPAPPPPYDPPPPLRNR